MCKEPNPSISGHVATGVPELRTLSECSWKTWDQTLGLEGKNRLSPQSKDPSISCREMMKQPLASDFLEQSCFEHSYFVVYKHSSVHIRACVLTVAGVEEVQRLGRCRSRS